MSSRLEATKATVVPIPVEHVAVYWPSVGPLLQLAINEAHGELQLADVLARLQTQHMQLLVAVKDDKVIAACVTEVVTHPRKTTLRVVLVGGKDMHAWIGPLTSVLELGAKNVGASDIEFAGRKGWVRALERYDGWHVKYYVMAKEV